MEIKINFAEDSNFGIPQTDHSDAMFCALRDFVTGNEEFTLAQHYSVGVLSSYCPGSITGTEGILDSIGAGIKKTWEYIKNMFKNLWGFFFKKDVAETAESKAADTDEEAKAAESIVKGEVADDKVVKALTATAVKDGKEVKIDDMSHEEFLKAFKEQSTADKQKAILTLVDQLKKTETDSYAKAVDIGLKLKLNFDNSVKTFNTESDKLMKMDANQLGENKKLLDPIVKNVADYMTKNQKFLDKIGKVVSGTSTAFMSVRDMTHAIAGSFRLNAELIKSFAANESKIQKLIKELEAKLNKNEATEEEKNDAKKDIKSLQAIMALSASGAKMVRGNVTLLEQVKATYLKLFGM